MDNICIQNNYYHFKQQIRHLFIILFAIFFICSTSFICYASDEIRINFKPGAVVGAVKGKLSSMNDEALYVLYAKAGQHMKVKANASGPTRGFVTFPNGESSGAPGDMFFDETLPITGDYHIRLIESPMGEMWKGNYTLEVEIH